MTKIDHRAVFGAGYWKGIESKRATESAQSDYPSLHGKWFHAVVGDKVTWQGQVLAVNGDKAMLQTYSWIDGSPSSQELIDVAEMRGWKLYDSDKQMRENWEKIRRIYNPEMQDLIDRATARRLC